MLKLSEIVKILQLDQLKDLADLISKSAGTYYLI